MKRFSDGLRLALTTFTIAPLRPPARLEPAWAMRLAPAVGALLGLVLAGLVWVLRYLETPWLVTGVVATAALALLTRGMHLDGLADTIDALGSYRSRERALEIMKSPEVGPFGVAAIVLALLVQAACFGTVTLPELIAAVATGRLAALIGCARWVPAARSNGLGSLVAGTVGPVAILVNAALIALIAGPLPVIAALLVSALLVWHCVRRFGGITGDVLGFLVEVGTAVALIGFVLRTP